MRLSPAALDAPKPWRNGYDVGDCAMPELIPSKLAAAKLSERDAWQRYAEAKDDSWRDAYAKWVEARDASLAVWVDEVSTRYR
jgi:hypothetical protein